MNQVINRFDLSGKSILSIGAGLGYEEYWFYKAQCKLTLLDIGYNHILRQTKEEEEPSLIYIVGDIYEVVKEFEDNYDLLYIAGMHRDMIYNKNKTGFSDLIFECIERFLDKGLFICQIIHGRIKMDDPQSVNLIKEQCRQKDLYLISIYHFSPRYTHVNLVTIFKGSEEELNEYMESIKENPEITRFHGRSEVITEIKKVYEYE